MVRRGQGSVITEGERKGPERAMNRPSQRTRAGGRARCMMLGLGKTSGEENKPTRMIAESGGGLKPGGQARLRTGGKVSKVSKSRSRKKAGALRSSINKRKIFREGKTGAETLKGNAAAAQKTGRPSRRGIGGGAPEATGKAEKAKDVK